jgi:hypothetical protein
MDVLTLIIPAECAQECEVGRARFYGMSGVNQLWAKNSRKNRLKRVAHQGLYLRGRKRLEFML